MMDNSRCVKNIGPLRYQFLLPHTAGVKKEIYLLDSPKCSHQADRMLTTTAEEFEVKMPDVGEYSKEMKLAFEKEVLGIYISGHPLEEYQEMWRRNITNTTADFMMDEESGEVAARDGRIVTIGGMIAEKKIKYTKNERVMAFLQVEDLLGSIEVIVFPGQYEKFGKEIVEDNKVFIRGGYRWKRKRTAS